MNTETFYDQYWASGIHVGSEMDAKSFARVFEPLIGRERVIDYGCGLGRTYQSQLVKAVQSYAGADVGPLAVADVQKKGLTGLKIDSNDGKIDAPSNAFDGATCIEVFEHLFNPLQSAQELYRVLKPGGVLVATVPNFGYHTWRLLAFLRAQVPSEPENYKVNQYNGVHIRFFSKLIFKRMLRDAGFVNITISSFHQSCDQSSIWHVFKAAGHFGHISRLADKYLPSALHLRFLQNVWPNVFAMRLRAVACKPETAKT